MVTRKKNTAAPSTPPAARKRKARTAVPSESAVPTPGQDGVATPTAAPQAQADLLAPQPKTTKRQTATAVRRKKTTTAKATLPPSAADVRPQAPQTLVHQPSVKQQGTGAFHNPAKSGVPASTQPTPVRIFQVFQERWQRDLLDPGFAALDQTRRVPELPELTLPEALLQHEATQSAALWGVVPWKFTQLTGMTSADLIKAVQDHPGADLYHCNPVPADEALYHNAWLQAETQQPGFAALAKAALEASQLNGADTVHIHPSNDPGDSLIVAASDAFWKAYLPFVQAFVRQTRTLSQEQRGQLLAQVQDDHALLNHGSPLGMLIRRLLPVFLKSAGHGLKAHKLVLPEKERALNVHEQLLREMKDVAHRSQSSWLAACWVNYRNLYLNQSKGKAWCQQHLRGITPTVIRFA